MLATALKLVGFDLQRQYVRLKAEAEAFKERTTDDIKQKAVDAGLQVALAFTGLVFIVLAVVAGLIALYLYIEIFRGPFVALGAVALVSAAFALITLIVAANWGRKRGPIPRPEPVVEPTPAVAATAAAAAAGAGSAVAPAKAVASPSYVPSADASPSFASPSFNASGFVDTLTKDLTDRTAAAASEAFDAAAGIVRKSPPEAIFGAMAVAVVAGILIGRRRADTP